MSLIDQPAPDFEFESTAGNSVRLSETLDDGPTVVVALRGTWCSYCAEQLQTLSQLEYDMWRHLDVDVLPVAASSLPALRTMRDRFDLSLQLLSDPDLELAAAYTGIEEHDEHGAILIPGTFIVDTDGIVRYEHVGENPADRTYANKIRAAIRHYECRDPYPDE